MKDLKQIANKLLFPPVWLIVFLSVTGTAGLILIFVKGMEDTPLAYAVYVLSFYSLTVVCIALSFVMPGCVKKIRQKIYSNKLGNRYMTDPAFKTHISLYRSLIINLLYAVFNLFSGIYYSSAWFMIFALYYIIMAVMRFILLRYAGKNGIGRNRLGELKRSRLCAYILMTVNILLSGAVLMMINFGRGFEYYGIFIYVVAMYTFYITTFAIAGMIKYRKYNSPIMSMAKSVSLASALISMLSLETAMFSQFGGEASPNDEKIMIIATGAGISIIVLCISLYTIRKTTKEIKELKNKEIENGK